MRPRADQLIPALALLLALAPRAHAADPAQYRRPLTVKHAATDAPGENIAYAEFYLNGAQKPDCSDLRIIDAVRGGPVPIRILQSSPNSDFVRVAFEARTDGTYTAWWGNDKAPKPAGDLVIKRGVLAEVFKFPGGGMGGGGRDNRVQRAFERAGPPQGALFVPDIFLAHNPLGEEWNAMIRYTAQFKVDKGGTYDIAFAASDAGTLTIDEKLIEESFRPNKLPGLVRQSTPVDLKPGWHTVQATQVNTGGGGQTGIVLAWKRPGDKGFATIPAGAFAPVTRATEGPLETVGKPYTADFSISPEAEAFAPPEFYFQRYILEARIPATFKPTYTFDFGDGQTAPMGRPHHYYLTPGDFSVTLKVQQAGVTYTATRRISVKDRMYSRFPRPNEDGPKTVFAVLNTYAPKSSSAEAAFRAMLFCKKHNENGEYVKWARAWLESKEATDNRTYREELPELSRMHLLRKEHKDAAEVYRLAAAHEKLPLDLRLQFIRSHVVVACDYLEDPAAALATADEWRKKAAPGNKIHEHAALAAIAYAAIAKGDGKLATKSAADAGARRDQPYDRQQLQQGVLARDIETYIRTKEFAQAAKLIDQWEFDYPESMIDGFTRLLRVKLLTAEQRPDIAARVALAHAKALPQSFYAAELLYRAAKQFEAAKDPEKSKAAMELLKSKYPESPYAHDKPKED